MGGRAPEFSARSQHGETVSSAELAGAPSLVMFFPFAFSRVCGSELGGLHARWPEVGATGARVVAVSCDPVHSLRAYAEMLEADGPSLGFDLLSDFWPHGQLAAAFGVFDGTRGAPLRTSFILDGDLIIQHVQQAEVAEARDLGEALERLRALS